MRHILRVGLVTLLLLLAGLPLAARVLPHADYARSEPAADAVLATPPKQVKVWFTQELFRRAGENWLHVIGPDGARVDLDDTAVDDNDRKLLTVTLADGLPDGAYRVEWRALSADDGHPKESEFGFAVGVANPAATATVPAVASTPHHAPEATVAAPSVAPTPASSQSGGLPCLGAAPLALLALGTVLVKRRRA
jgi:methionine-rich copper-binding protein CopC